MILVVGSTSSVGTRVIPQLLAQDEKVRAMTRTPSSARAESLRISPGQAHNNLRTVDDVGNRGLIDAARAAGVQHFVFISILGVSPTSPMELFRIKYATEQYLQKIGLSYTILRAGAFMELWAALVGEPILKTGKTTIFGRGNNPINFVSAEDVARFSVLALQDSRMHH